ncbi:MAG: C-type lectin domain-containing protein [Phycisphaerae bacterium]|jgi:hypothetical protein|nr:C-type lectin domain-containing protein [Phycisphaerae bacterium]
MGKLMTLGLAVAAVCTAVSPALGDAKSDYAELFGKKAARVLSSRTKTDDIAFARELLESAAAVSESPTLQVFLYEKVLSFAGTSVEGLPIALGVMDILEEKFPDRKTDWQVKRLGLLRSKYTRAVGKAKKPAAIAYLDALMSAADALMAAGKSTEALAHYRSARTPASYYRKEMLPEIRWKLTQAGSAALVETKIKRLKSKLKIDPNDTKSREELMRLYVVQIDAPAEAQSVMSDTVSEPMRKHVPLARKSTDELSADNCLSLGNWYYKTLRPKASGAGKRIVLQRAYRYYERFVAQHERFVAQHERADIPRVQASLAMKRIETELARLGPRKSVTTARIPKDAVAFGRHHYKSIAAASIPWAEAVKACKKLGGHLVTIESSGEMAFLQKLVGSGRLWVGATDQPAEGKWLWINGRGFSREVKLWASGEPNEGRAANYASMTSVGLRDNANPSSRVGGFICEWDR